MKTRRCAAPKCGIRLSGRKHKLTCSDRCRQALSRHKRRTKPHVARNSGNHEWYTPSEIIEAARMVMGGIDLDPASAKIANLTVQATRYFDTDDDGLAQAWRGRIYLNPPYDRGLVDRFVEKLLGEPIDQAIVLVNNGTETAWGQRLFTAATAACFPSGRIRFLLPDGRSGAPLQGQVIFGLNVSFLNFQRAFSGIGSCINCDTSSSQFAA